MFQLTNCETFFSIDSIKSTIGFHVRQLFLISYRRLIFDFFWSSNITWRSLVIHFWFLRLLVKNCFGFENFQTVLAFSSRFTNLNQHEIIFNENTFAFLLLFSYVVNSFRGMRPSLNQSTTIITIIVYNGRGEWAEFDSEDENVNDERKKIKSCYVLIGKFIGWFFVSFFSLGILVQQNWCFDFYCDRNSKIDTTENKYSVLEWKKKKWTNHDTEQFISWSILYMNSSLFDTSTQFVVLLKSKCDLSFFFTDTSPLRSQSKEQAADMIFYYDYKNFHRVKIHFTLSDGIITHHYWERARAFSFAVFLVIVSCKQFKLIS